ncbi:N,N-dimethylformamidase beta subunit family domain-containing protein [Actinokineospora sp.]|uniref:N,N-dimethylformamidase beta subunit family domain-containing protein n=1 Tax=Actinokineospora sp. TaxID=1872133 RepID=UPI004037B392
MGDNLGVQPQFDPADYPPAAFNLGGQPAGFEAPARPVPAGIESTNAIVLENQLPGAPASQWDLAGEGSTNIEGFATQISVNRGTTVQFKINTNSANYRIDIYRLGYYAGLGARLVHTMQQNVATVQPAAGGDPAVRLHDAGNWQVSASWAVPASAVSGVYLAKLVRQDATAGENHIPFIVRDDGVQRDIVFQTADTTWHAYNGWGGHNLYGDSATDTTALRAYKVSYNRPIGTRDRVGTYSGPQDFVLSAEYAAIRWLERNGYDVAYIAGVDSGPGNAQLTNYRVFMSTGHDEYWSGDQRARVEAARDAGVHLIFISGNEVYWKTRWEPDLNGTPNRTLVCYKETRAGEKIDPSPQWTGTWRDPSFSPPSDGGKPENALTGTIFQVDSHRRDTIKVPFSLSRLRFWRNTSVATILSGQTASLADGALGYEWDESPDNGFRPGGLIHLSSTTATVENYLRDYGRSVGPRSATHKLALYRAPSGAIVFGAGTVFWSFGLDTVHDYSGSGPVIPTPEDPITQQVMVNLFADMGVQPQTLQVNLVVAAASTDVTPPVSTITAPTTGSSRVQQTKVTISGTASDTAPGRVAAVEVSTDGGTTWRLATGTTSWTFDWWPQLPGTYTIKSRAVDDSLNLQTPVATVTITVTPSAAVTLFTPGDVPATVLGNDPNPVELGFKFRVNTPGSVAGVKFYKNPHNVGTHVAHLWSAGGTLLATANFTGETASGWQQANFGAPVAITPGSTYIASYHTNGFYSITPNYYINSRTGGAVTAPTSATSGGNGVYAYGGSGIFPGGSYLASNYWVDVVFNRAGGAGNLAPTAGNDGGFATGQNVPLAIPAASLLANDTDPNGYPLSITGVSGPVNGTVSYDAGTKVVTFTPTANFTGQAGFGYAIANGFGGVAAATVSLTVNPPGQMIQSLFSFGDTPATLTANDVHPVQLGVKFQSSVAGQVKGIRFYKGPQNTSAHTAHLWSATGTLLASATFAGETATGWQTVNFAAPVTMAANTTYIASYHAVGFYSATSNYFATPRTSGTLTAPAGANGVYTYGGPGSFPTSTFNSTNYWVDVIVQTPSP